MTQDRQRAWLLKHGALGDETPHVYTGPVALPGEADAYARAALDAELLALSQSREPGRNDQLNASAFALAQLVAAGHLEHDTVWNALYYTAIAVGLEEGETRRTLLSAFRSGQEQPRNVPPKKGSDVPPTTIFTDPGPTDDEEGSWPPILDWNDLWEHDDPEEWIIEPLLPARRLVALYSPAKAGKSLLMLELAVAISRGEEVIGSRPDGAHRVLYVDLENDPRGDIRTRLQQMGKKPADLGGLAYLSFPELPMLDTFVGGLRLMEVLAHYECNVVVIDTISRLVAGEENDNNTWLSFYRHTGRLLKAAGITAVRLDHTGKDPTKGMRGGSAKYSDVDLVWSMTAPTDGVVTLECMAQRLPVREKLLVLERVKDPWLHHKIKPEGRVAAVEMDSIETLNFIDQIIGEDTELGIKAAMRLLTEHGHGRRFEFVKEVIALRDLRFMRDRSGGS